MMSAQSPNPQSPIPKTLYLIDGSGYIFRAYHALPPLTNPAGTPVGAVYGFITMLSKLMEGTKADYVAVVFDAGRSTFRNRIYPEYKANRPEAPEDLVPQFALVRDAADALSIPRVELEDVEADDLIATYARLARAEGMEVVVISSDKDLMQLIGEGVRLHDPMKNKPIGEPEVLEKFGVAPNRVRDVLALMGDSSDNVPGVRGIGPKTASELITQFGDLETLLARAGEIKQPKRREMLETSVDMARLSYELVGLKDDVAVPVPLADFALRQPDTEKLRAFLETHGFKTLLARLKEKFGFELADSSSQLAEKAAAICQLRTTNYELIQDEASLRRWVDAAREKGIVAFDTETTSLDANRAHLVGFSLSMEAGRACYVPVGHRALGSGDQALGNDLFDAPKPQSPKPNPLQIPLQSALALLKPLLEDESVLKIGQNIKYDMLVLKRYNINVTPVDDTMLLSYTLDAGLHGHGMDELAGLHLQHATIKYDDVTGTGKARISFAEVELEKARDYAAEDADITLRLWQALKPRVASEHLLSVYETIDRPLIPVLAAMEKRGVRVDVSSLRDLSQDFAKRMVALEAEIHTLAGREFNVGSPKQLGEVLFDEMKLEGGRKSGKTGAYSTDSYVLEDLADTGTPIAAKVLEWRTFSKLKGTYTDALAEHINPETGRVHTSFGMAIASTGRLSSTDPNLQNIRIRTNEGKKIRRAFIAAPGHKLISADYSQIELRLLAHVADISTLKEAFKNGQDIHAITASQVFGIPINDVTADHRRSAKTINFGIIYGMSAHGLATRLGIGRPEAAAMIERYCAQYPGIRGYMDAMKEVAHKQGYVETLYGRRCHLPMINDKNGARRQFAERAAINAPLQGTAADIIKKAMVKIEHSLSSCAKAQDPSQGKLDPAVKPQDDVKCKMLLQVHDELVFEVKEGYEEQALKIIKPAMENAAQFSVPLTVESGVGSNWGEIH